MQLRLRGRLQDFPFTTADPKVPYTWRISGQRYTWRCFNFLQAYWRKMESAPWPVIDNINWPGFVFEKARNGDSGRYGSHQPSNLSVNFQPSSLILAVMKRFCKNRWKCERQFTAMFNHVKASPVDDWIGNFTRRLVTVMRNCAQIAVTLHAIIDSRSMESYSSQITKPCCAGLPFISKLVWQAGV